MKRLTVTIELDDDDAAWLESWDVYFPVVPQVPLTIEQKIAACVSIKAEVEQTRQEFIDLEEMALEDERREEEARLRDRRTGQRDGPKRLN